MCCIYVGAKDMRADVCKNCVVQIMRYAPERGRGSQSSNSDRRYHTYVLIRIADKPKDDRFI